MMAIEVVLVATTIDAIGKVEIKQFRLSAEPDNGTKQL